MGIRGMESYLERYDSYSCYPVNIREQIERARLEGHNLTIVVDAMSCLRYMYGDLPWIPGGQVKEFIENVQEFAQSFISLGAKLVFFYDGPPAEVKIEEWKRRRLETIDKVHDLMDKLNAGVPASSLEGGDWQVIPPNIGTLSGIALKQIGCTVIRSIGDCDEEIARYAYQNRCLAIFGQDTDFVIYPGAKHYWSVKHFNKQNMTTLEYSGRKLAASLHLSYEQLPLLASLLGNDIIKRDDLMTFHKRIASNHYVPVRYVNFQKSIHNVARFIRRYPGGDGLKQYFPALAQEVFNDQRKWELIRDSVQSYDITQPARDDLECKSGDEKWDAVLQLVRDAHISGATPQLYGAVVRGIYNCSTCLEDYRLDDLPPNQLILKKLRKKIFGILVFEKPQNQEETHIIREMAVSGPRSLDRYEENSVILPTVPHPGLVALWNRGDSTLNDVRWALLCNAVNIDPLYVRDGGVPLHLAIFVLTMKYLMDEGMSLKKFELDALVSSAIILNDYTPQMLKQLPTDPLDTRALRLYTLVARSYGSLLLLNSACGYPIPEHEATSDKYQDGKLYHQAYRNAKSGCQISQLCDLKIANVEVFHAIVAILPTDKAVVE